MMGVGWRGGLQKAFRTINLNSNKTTLESVIGKVRNLGKGNAIICAFPFQGHKCRMTMDSRGNMTGTREHIAGTIATSKRGDGRVGAKRTCTEKLN